MVHKLVMRLEMAAPEALRPARAVDGLQVRRVADPAGADAARVRALHAAIATPHHWSSLAADDEQWREALSGPGRSNWLATAEGRDVGWANLRASDAGDVEITAFGLRPDALGRGCGGAFLTEVVRAAWRLLADAGPATGAGPVWLSTSSWDHPHALANYLARGFHVAHTELQQRRAGTRDRPSKPVSEPPRFLPRPAVAADAAAVAPLLESLGYPRRVATVEERLGRLASSPDDVVAVVVERPGKPVGFISAHIVPLFAEAEPGFARITALSVAPGAAGMGVGRRLVEFVEFVARSRGLSLLEVSSGRRPERAAAHRFYAALGFADSAASAVRYWKALDTEPAAPDRRG